jgi:hypothetical protein
VGFNLFIAVSASKGKVFIHCLALQFNKYFMSLFNKSSSFCVKTMLVSLVAVGCSFSLSVICLIYSRQMSPRILYFATPACVRVSRSYQFFLQNTEFLLFLTTSACPSFPLLLLRRAFGWSVERAAEIRQTGRQEVVTHNCHTK